MEQVENPMVLPKRVIPIRVVSFCVQCNVKLFADEEFLELDKEHFCDTLCLRDYLGVKRVEGWELNER